MLSTCSDGTSQTGWHGYQSGWKQVWEPPGGRPGGRIQFSCDGKFHLRNTREENQHFSALCLWCVVTQLNTKPPVSHEASLHWPRKSSLCFWPEHHTHSQPFTGSLTFPMKTRMSLHRSDQNTDNCLQVSWYHRSPGSNSLVNLCSAESLPRPSRDTKPAAVGYRRVNSGPQRGRETASSCKDFNQQKFPKQHSPCTKFWGMCSLFFMKISCRITEDPCSLLKMFIRSRPVRLII